MKRKLPRPQLHPRLPAQYHVVMISLYDEDLKALDAKVRTLKGLSVPRASRSAFIRAALAQFTAEDFVRRQP